MLRHPKQVQVLNEVTDDDDEDTGKFSVINDTAFDTDYTESMTSGTHVICDSESDNGEVQETINKGLEGVSYKFVWQNMGTVLLKKLHFVMCMVPSSILLSWMSCEHLHLKTF